MLAAGDLPPADLPLRDDLRSRMGWGMCSSCNCWMKPRAAPCCARKQTPGRVLGDEVMDFMLKRFSRDLGSLMQLLDQLDAFALRTSVPSPFRC